MASETPVTNALSFDIEDWFHLVEIKAVEDSSRWPDLSTLVQRETEWILETVADAGVRATFFILGWIAERYPEIPKMIASAGHELGTHSYWHRRVYLLSPNELRDDLRQAIDAIEQPTGSKVLGVRAPSFSIVPGTEWAFDVFHELDLKYDASLFPAHREHGGYPCSHEPHEFRGAPSGKPMLELPMSVLKYGLLSLPFSGGGYMRLLPEFVIRAGFDRLNRRGVPVVVYLHPRDFAEYCPRVPMPLRRRFKCYVGLKSTRDKLRMILDRYSFDTCASVLGLDDEGNRIDDMDGIT